MPSLQPPACLRETLARLLLPSRAIVAFVLPSCVYDHLRGNEWSDQCICVMNRRASGYTGPSLRTMLSCAGGQPLERDQSLLYASVRCGAGCVLRLGRRMLEKNRVLCKQTHGVTTSGRKHAYACFPLRTPPRRNKPQQAATSRNTPQDNSSTELRFSITTTDRSRSQLQPKQRNEPKWPKTRRNMSNTGLT